MKAVTDQRKEELKELASIIAMYIRNQSEDIHVKHIDDSVMKKMNKINRDSIYTILLSMEESALGNDHATALIGFQKLLMPSYWEDPEETEEYKNLKTIINQ